MRICEQKIETEQPNHKFTNNKFTKRTQINMKYNQYLICPLQRNRKKPGQVFPC